MTEGSKIEVKVNLKELKPYQKNVIEVILAEQRERVRADFEKRMLSIMRNSRYGKFGSLTPSESMPVLLDRGEVVLPHNLYPYSTFQHRLQMQGRVLREPLIPALEVPEAPTAPEPVVEPESASVQMLRKLLADRHRELEREEAHKAETLETIEGLKAELASEEEDLAQHERHIAAAAASIEQVLADIKALGGRDEVKPEA